MKALIKVSNPVIADRLAAYERSAGGALSENTVKALRADTGVFTGWCAKEGLDPLPSTPETVAGFIDAHGDRAPATLRRYVSSIAHLHSAAGVTDPTKAVTVTLAIKRHSRANGTRQKQAEAVNRPHVDRMIAAQEDTPGGLRNRALIAVAYDTLCRRSELVALDMEDLARADDGSGTITLRKSKTDQEGAGQVRYLAPDTMEHLDAWLGVAGITEGPIFRSVRKGGGAIGEALSDRAVSRILKVMAQAAGLDIDPSGHSVRVGCSQDMIAAGFSLPEVMQAAGWKSPAMPARYSEHLLAKRGAAAKLATMQNRA